MSIRAAAFSIIALFIAAGCEPNRFFGHAGPILIRENGRPAEKQIVQVDVPPPWWAELMGATVYVEEFVVDAAPAPDDQRAIDHLVDRAPPWTKLAARRQYDAVDVALNATTDQPASMVRWIISLHPLVIGLGPAPATPRRDTRPMELRTVFGYDAAKAWMITDADWDARVSTLIVVDPFPAYGKDLHPTARVYPLPNPMTLRELLNSPHLPPNR